MSFLLNMNFKCLSLWSLCINLIWWLPCACVIGSDFRLQFHSCAHAVRPCSIPYSHPHPPNLLMNRCIFLASGFLLKGQCRSVRLFTFVWSSAWVYQLVLLLIVESHSWLTWHLPYGAWCIWKYSTPVGRGRVTPPPACPAAVPRSG